MPIIWGRHAHTRPSDNAVVWKWENSDPFGANLPNENPSGLGAFAFNLRFPGQYYDQETGTHYNYFRDYDPATGRYVQSDPIGLSGGINTYGYVGASPLMYFDPDGLKLCSLMLPTRRGPREFLLDDTISDRVEALLRRASSEGIPVTVNEAFRTRQQQQDLWDARATNPNLVARPGTSRHESGFAIDVDVRRMTPTQDSRFAELATLHGLMPFEPRKKDPPHFQADPRRNGYNSLNEAIRTNQADYLSGQIPSCSCVR